VKMTSEGKKSPGDKITLYSTLTQYRLRILAIPTNINSIASARNDGLTLRPTLSRFVSDGSALRNDGCR